MGVNTKKRVAVIAALVLTLGILPAQVQTTTAVATTKGYSISMGSGTYSTDIQTRIKAKKGYKVYYTTANTFSTKKVIKSGKTKTINVKKNTTLKVIAVKKSKSAKVGK